MNRSIRFFFLCILFSSCGKEFLDKKQNAAQVIPTTITDFQALLDDSERTINAYSGHELGIIGSDEYMLSNENWNTLPAGASPYERRGYFWDKNDVYEGGQVRDWDYTYRKILYANTALEGIDKIKANSAEQAAWNNVKGSALFIRAYSFYQLAQLFCKPYHTLNSNQDLGIPLRLTSDVTSKDKRNTVQETYDRILSDLLESLDLLPDKAQVKYRPSKSATAALLAKTYLLMGKYRESLKYADMSLKTEHTLIDFNQLDLSSEYCFPIDMQQNPEILYIGYIPNMYLFQPGRAHINPELYDSYAQNDLSKMAYFEDNGNQTYNFKGSYFGSTTPLFTGLTVEEVLLIKAECSARAGDLVTASETLNSLLENRYEKAGYIPIAFSDQEQAINEILSQRRKRLILRGIRWEDLRRLNQEPKYQVSIIRNLNGVRHELIPNESRYVWPIPDKAIEFGHYMQNPR